MNTLPHWRMESIYPSFDSTEFLSDLDRVRTISEKISSQISNLSLKDLIGLYNDMGETASTLYSYAYACLSVDTTNSSVLKALSEAEDAVNLSEKTYKVLVKEINKRKSEKNDLEGYDLFFHELEMEEEHLMSEKEENLALDLGKSSSASFSRLQETLISSIKSGDKTFNELRALAYSSDRNVRKDAYYREKEALKENEIAFSYALNGVKGIVSTLDDKRGWDSSLDHSLFSSRFSRKGLDSLICAIEERVDIFHRYLKVKARLLGLEKLSYYDIFAPVGKSRRYEFCEAVDIVYSAFSSFSPAMGAFFKKAVDLHWIDAEPRKGKIGGAYDEIFKSKGESRILLNYDYSYDSVSTLAHESGHAYHDSLIMDKPYIHSTYPMTLAESASTFSELITLESVLKGAEKDEKAYLLDQMLMNLTQCTFDIISRFYFEKEVFEKRRKGELTAEEFSSAMLSAFERTYSSYVKEKHELMWAVKSHYYIDDYSYYNYPYAFGALFSLALFKKSKESDNFYKEYEKMLSLTGEMDVKDALKTVGFDSESKDFYLSSLSMIDAYLKELETCL